MVCVHVRKLYQLCEAEGLRLSGSDLIHIVCKECNVKESCPSMLLENYDEDEAPERSTAPIASREEDNAVE